MRNDNIWKLILLYGVFLAALSGCASTSKPYIPDQLPEVEPGMARIVVSRESQLAGARWSLDLVDVGENIDPNGLISYRFINTDYFVRLEDLPRSQMSGDLSFDFYWRNPDMTASLYCGDGSSECKRTIDGGLYRGDIGLLWSSGVALGLSGKNGVEIVQNGRRLLEDLNPLNQLINKIFGQENLVEYPPTEVARVFQSLYRNQNLNSLLESIRTGHLERSILHEEINLGIFGTGLGEKTQQTGVVQDLGALGAIARKREDFAAFRLKEPDIDIVITTSMPYWRSNKPDAYMSFMLIDDRDISRNIQLIDQIGSGDTVIWDRKPGLMRLALIWYDGIDIMPQDITVEAGKTYHVHYTVRQPKTARWEVKGVDW